MKNTKNNGIFFLTYSDECLFLIKDFCRNIDTNFDTFFFGKNQKKTQYHELDCMQTQNCKT